LNYDSIEGFLVHGYINGYLGGNAHPLVWENQPCNFTIAHAVAPVSVSVLLVLFLHLLPVPGEGKHEEQNSTCAKDRDVEWGFNQSTL
jgi:hypothetical protein